MTAAEITEVPSPFCGIGSDDLVVKSDGVRIEVVANGCAVNTPAFEQAMGDATPRIDGRPVSLATAVARAADLLRAARQPVIGGCATDVSGMRALLALADTVGAVVDAGSFNVTRRNLLTLQDGGWMNTSLTEIRNRCDFLLVVGTVPENFAPRFFERGLWTEEAIHLADPSAREVVYLGKAPCGEASTSPSGQKAQVLACADNDLPSVLAVLSARVKKQVIQAQSVGGIAVSELQAVVDKLRNAKYGVVLWGADALDYDHAELTVQAICNIVKDINQQGTRCSGFPLGGKEGDQTASQVCGWITGYPARISFARGYPEYDPFLYDTQAMLAGGEADVLVWVHAFDTQATPPETNVPTIVIGRSGMCFHKQHEVFIPIGTPGIDHVGHAYRMDSAIALRLKKLRDANLPSTAEILNAIASAA